MNPISNLTIDKFETLCAELLKQHAFTVCDPTQFISPLPPHYSDFDPANFEFKHKKDKIHSIWTCGYDSTVGRDYAMLGIYIAVWQCKYFVQQEIKENLEAKTLSEMLARELCSILKDLESEIEYPIFDEYSKCQIIYTAFTNAPIDPELGDPNLVDLLFENIDKYIKNVKSQIATASTLPWSLSLKTGIKSKEDGSTLDEQLSIIRQQNKRFFNLRSKQ